MNSFYTPAPVARALKQIGENISLARRARGWSQQDFAERLDASISTVRRLESGFHGAALHTFLRALYLLDLLDELISLTSVENDKLGVSLLQRQLPKHIHSKNRSRTKPANPANLVQENKPTSHYNPDELEGF